VARASRFLIGLVACFATHDGIPAVGLIDRYHLLVIPVLLGGKGMNGSALCVTEGYRSYSEQVAVKLRLPGLAATPGTSKHGLGLAVDLCGGVQDFANPAHLWLNRWAPLFGWHHPAWAEPSGALPEPWHWEFAG
jgi:hypothetical protein